MKENLPQVFEPETAKSIGSRAVISPLYNLQVLGVELRSDSHVYF